MLKLYCLPGKLFASLGYLFPGKGQLWASARRRESRLAHFIFATPFWALVAFMALGAMGLRNGITMDSRPSLRPSEAGSKPIEQVAEFDADAEATTNVKPDKIEAVEPETRDKSADNIDPSQESASNDTSEIDDPGRRAAVREAVQKAFSSGETQRWEDGGLKGYAVASSPSTDGCRNISYSVDSLPDAQFPPVKVCP